MKKFITIMILILLTSCSKTTDNKEPGMIQETKQIINDYPDTLESSIQDAKKVTKQYNQNAQDLERQLQNATK
ncbi:MAG: hypothetical protein WC850_04710 [Candidatus Gracilibacteria bacterium]